MLVESGSMSLSISALLDEPSTCARDEQPVKMTTAVRASNNFFIIYGNLFPYLFMVDFLKVPGLFKTKKEGSVVEPSLILTVHPLTQRPLIFFVHLLILFLKFLSIDFFLTQDFGEFFSM